MNAPLVKVQDAFSETAIDDEIVVMSLRSGDFFSLTGTGRAVWLAIDGARSRDGVVAALAAQYGADETRIGADVDSFIAQLRGAGLLESA